MPSGYRKRLRTFYHQALLAPELLCLSCAHTAWNQAACRCSERRRQDCLLFANEFSQELEMTPPPGARGRTAGNLLKL